MLREDRFVISHRPYALDLDSLRAEINAGWKGDFASCTFDAVWFNRKDKVTRACVGTLRGTQWGVPADAAEFLAGFTDGRYGGDCLARWDGTGFWAAGQDPDENAKRLALLRVLLNAYEADPKDPVLPDPWNGWWRF